MHQSLKSVHNTLDLELARMDPHDDASYGPAGSGGPDPATQRYRIWLAGIKSHRCADDVGPEIGCDEEEPYIVWIANAEDYTRVGITPKCGHMVKNSEGLFAGDVASTNLFSASPDSASHALVKAPLSFCFQVMEADPGHPSNEELKEFLTAAGVLGVSIITENWAEVFASGAELIASLAEISMNLAGGGDDRYPIQIVTYSNLEALLQDTTGPTGPNGELFQSAGSYDHRAVHTRVVKKGDKNQWTVLWVVSRASGAK
jgi:hypothetical protein